MLTNREDFETENGQLVHLALESDLPQGRRTWAVVSMQLVDEISMEPPTGQIKIKPKENGPQSQVGSRGFAGLVGIPANLFPNLRNQSYSLDLDVRVEGYLPMHLTAPISQSPTFPDRFVPANLGRIALHTQPTQIRGRVVQVNAAGVVTPLGGIALTITGFWATMPTPLNNPAASPANMVAIFPPMYTARSIAQGSFQRRDLITVLGQDKTLENFAPAGTRVLDLSNARGVNLGNLLRIDEGPLERTEIMEIMSLEGGSTPDQPARITTRFPLVLNHARGTLVRLINPQAPGVSKSFTREVYAGDSSLYLNDLTGLASREFVEITQNGLEPEYHSIVLYSAISGIEGFFRLPPVHRAAQVTLNARRPPLTDVNLTFSPDYQQDENRVDVIFRP
jgi:hypothetical protein